MKFENKTTRVWSSEGKLVLAKQMLIQ